MFRLREVSSAPTALLMCGEGSVSCAMLERLVGDAGFEVVGSVEGWIEVVQHVAHAATDVAILDLELAGSVGVRIVRIVRAAAPSCQVIAISPLEGLDRGALEAGALEVVRANDLRPVTVALRRIAASRTSA